MTVDPDPDPFVGPRPFGIDGADRFFGRSREAWDLTYSGVLSRRLVVVAGPTGVGKTSLLQAGVLAMIRPDIAHVLPVARLDCVAARPVSKSNRFVDTVLSAWNAGDVFGTRARPSLSQFLRDTSEPIPPLIVAVLDQFDAVFAGNLAASQREEFLDQLCEAMEEVSHLHLVLGIRQDALDRLTPIESRLSGGDGWRYLLASLSPGAALEAISHPLRRTRRVFGPGVGELLVDNLRTTTFIDADGAQRTVVATTVDPTILQVVCKELWRALPAEVTTISAIHIQQFGDVETALTAVCLRAVIDVSVATHQPLQALWDWLATTFVTDLGTRGSAYEGMTETSGMPNEVARAFARNHILRSEVRAGAVWYELLDDLLVQAVRRGRQFAEDLAELSSSRSSTDAFLVLAESALNSGRLLDAEQYARGAVRANRTDAQRLAEAESFLGQLVFDQGRRETGERAEKFYATAQISLQSAAELYETSQNKRAVGRALAVLGRLHMVRGQHSEALRKLRMALDRLESDNHVRIDFARALSQAGQLQAALGEYTRVLEDDSRTVEALVGRGTLSVKRGYAAAALRDLEAAIRIQPDIAERADVILARRQAAAHLDRRS